MCVCVFVFECVNDGRETERERGVKRAAGSQSDSLLGGCEYPVCFIRMDQLESLGVCVNADWLYE